MSSSAKKAILFMLLSLSQIEGKNISLHMLSVLNFHLSSNRHKLFMIDVECLRLLKCLVVHQLDVFSL
jgi:hypothetical protein